MEKGGVLCVRLQEWAPSSAISSYLIVLLFQVMPLVRIYVRTLLLLNVFFRLWTEQRLKNRQTNIKESERLNKQANERNRESNINKSGTSHDANEIN